MFATAEYKLHQEVTLQDRNLGLRTLTITVIHGDYVELAENKYSRPILATSIAALARRDVAHSYPQL